MRHCKLGDIRIRKISGKTGEYQKWMKVSYNCYESNGGWKRVSHIVWEKANGRTLPAGWVIIHIDGNKLHNAPYNLLAVAGNSPNRFWSERQRILYGLSGTNPGRQKNGNKRNEEKHRSNQND